MRPPVLGLGVVCLVAGCARIFGLDTGAVTYDAPPDELAIDAPVFDAPPCAVGHDEDLDKVDDGCDRCPTVADKAQPDADADGVGDACDPDGSAADSIALFDGFAGSDLDVGVWNVMSGTPKVAGDEVSFGTSAEVRSLAPYLPRRIAIEGQIDHPADGSTLELYVADGTVSCKARVGSCKAFGPNNCLLVHIDGVDDVIVDWPDVGVVRSLTMDVVTDAKTNVTTFTCTGTDANGKGATGSRDTATVAGAVGVQIGRVGGFATDVFHVKNLIVYSE